MRKKSSTSKLKVRRARAGLGLFTLVPIKKEDLVIEYIGEKISRDESDRRGGKYLFTVKKDVVIDGKGRKNLARYINHSCTPNCEPEVDEEKEKIFIYAKKDIPADTELTYNYGKEYFDDHIKPYGCKCEKCREKKRRK